MPVNKLFSPKQLAERNPAFSEPSIRAHIFKAKDRKTSIGTIPGNGLAPAIIKIGRKVLIDEVKFLEWVLQHQSIIRGS